MFAVLLDVSDSMREAYSRNRSHDTSVRRTHAVLTTTAEIVKQEVTRHNRDDSIFTCVFGLSKPTTTCGQVDKPDTSGSERECELECELNE